MTIEKLPLMLRSFENTIGYWWIKGNNLSDCTKALFDEGNYNDYSVVTTQLFEENFTYYLTCMNKNYKPEGDTINLNRFKNVNLNESFFINSTTLDLSQLKDEKSEIHKLLEFVVKKRYISNASWIAFSAIYALYICNLSLL
jgi:hypothetical protein